MSEMTENQCKALLAAFERRCSLPEGHPGRGNPLTPNDPATIAVLASEVLELREENEKLKAEVEAKVDEQVGGLVAELGEEGLGENQALREALEYIASGDCADPAGWADLVLKEEARPRHKARHTDGG